MAGQPAGKKPLREPHKTDERQESAKSKMRTRRQIAELQVASRHEQMTRRIRTLEKYFQERKVWRRTQDSQADALTTSIHELTAGKPIILETIEKKVLTLKSQLAKAKKETTEQLENTQHILRHLKQIRIVLANRIPTQMEKDLEEDIIPDLRNEIQQLDEKSRKVDSIIATLEKK